jgi:hypothetical protein
VFNDNRGWAVLQNGNLVAAETAVLQTMANTVAYAAGTRLTFVLTQNYDLTGPHAVGRFRLSVTTSPRTQFADGNDGTSTPGNIGSDSIWTVLAPAAVCTSPMVGISSLGDKSILVTPNSNVPVVYTVVTDTTLKGITGVRLETLKDPSLPMNGPGLSTMDGNFVLTEFEGYAGAP